MKNHLKTANFLAHALDDAIHIGSFSFGLSAIIDLLPGVGDIIDALLSLYIVWIAFEIDVPALVLLRMIGNIGINFIFGLIPIAGDAIYFIRKVNLKNLSLLKEYSSQYVEEGTIIKT